MSTTRLSALSEIVLPEVIQAEARCFPLTTTLIVIDPAVVAYETLIAGALPTTTTLILNPEQDGIEQITQALKTHPHITTLHLISHGSPGCLYLGNSQLNLETLNTYAPQLQQWFSYGQSTSNGPEGDPNLKSKIQNPKSTVLLLYGCNVAIGDAGEELLTRLHQLTGANIAAAESLTGNTELGGNWDLTYRIGSFEPSPAFTLATLSTYPSVLANPTLLGKYDTSGYARDVVVVGNYAYVADSDSGLQILNISDPYNPSLVGSYNTPGDSWGLQVVGSYAYVADGSSGLQIINISSPSSPTLTQAVSVSDARGVAVAGNYAYVTSAWGSLKIFDISNPATPIACGSASVTNQAWDVVVVGNYAYVTYGSGVQQVPATSKSGLQIFNISNPNNPTLVGEYKTPGNNSYNVAVAGNYAYIADGTSGLQILNISNPANPTLVGSYDTEDFAHGIAVVDNYAYVASGASLLYVLDVSNPASPTLIGSYDPPDNTYGVTVAGNYVYVSDGYKGVEILTKLNGVIPPPNQAPTAANKTVTTAENTAYTFQSSDFSFSDADGDSLQAIQITSLQTAGYLFLDNNGNSSQDGGEAVVANQQIVVANLGKLKFRPVQDADGQAYTNFGFKVSDGKAYSSSAYTVTINVTAASNPTPSNPTPSNPTPSNPTPSNPTPSNPTPSNPTPERPISQDQTGIPTASINFHGGKHSRQGTNRSDRLTGSNRSEWMRGKGGNDRLSGKGKRDLLEGGAGKDTLRGGSGDDILVGGAGNDRLLGGAGKDTYVYKSVKDGVDTIIGFENSDLFDLRPIFTQSAFGGVTPLARLQQFVRLEQVGSNTRVNIDADGNGNNNTFITLAILINVSVDTIHSNHFVVT